MTVGYVFDRPTDHRFVPRPYAAGPYAGLQGGCVAGVAATVIENEAPSGFAPLSFRIDFVRPAPLAELTVSPQLVHAGRRLHRYDATVSADGRQVARASMILAQPQPVKHVGAQTPIPPQELSQAAAHWAPATRPYPWMMDVFEFRNGPDAIWFRWKVPLTPAATPFAHLLGPADWAHGLAVPAQRDESSVRGWPNVDLSLQVARAPVEGWIGLRPHTLWDAAGTGIGGAALVDERGELGTVSMAVVLLTD